MMRTWTLCALITTVMLMPSHTRASEDEQLWLARICVHEAGWDSPEDCAALYQALRSLRDEMHERNPSYDHTIVDAIRYYSPRFYAGTSARPWARWATVGPRTTTPQGWPLTVTNLDGTSRPHPPWHAYRERWARAYGHAGAVLQASFTGSCAASPRHWGMRTGIDAVRARRAIARGDWYVIDCGSTRNAYYGVHRR